MNLPPKTKSAVGNEYVLIVTAEGLLDRKLLFECTLCEKIQRYSKLYSHLSSKQHRLKFLEIHFPRTHELLRTRKYSSNEHDLQALLEIVVEEILRNIPQKPILEVEYMDYENHSKDVYEQVSKSIGTYDNMKLFVTEMNYLLNQHFEPIDEYDTSSNIAESATKDAQATDDGKHPIIDLTNIPDDEVLQTPAESLEDDKSDLLKLIQTIESATVTPKEVEEAAPMIQSAEEDSQAGDTIESMITDEQKSVPVASTVTVIPAVTGIPVISAIPTVSVEQNIETPALTDASNSLEVLRDEARISMYNEKIRKLEKEISNQYEVYLKDPSNHPKFIGEWKKFYLEKSFEISVRRKYSYTETWIAHWSEYIKNLKKQDLEKSESTLKRKLKMLPEDSHILSDISDAELEDASPPKRPKLEHEEALQNVLTKPVETLSETDRMLIAYNIAYENFINQKKLSLDELLEKMKPYVVAKEPNDLQTKLDFNDNDISNVCLQNFNNLSQNVQANFLSVMHSMKLNDFEGSTVGKKD